MSWGTLVLCLLFLKSKSFSFLKFQQDTKNLRLNSRLQARLVSFRISLSIFERFSFAHILFDLQLQVWKDPDLAWNTSVYEYDRVVLPVSKVWTPELHVTNGSVGFSPGHKVKSGSSRLQLTCRLSPV